MRKENGATLSAEARSTFFRLFLPLLDFVNQKYGISDELYEQFRRGRADAGELKKVAEALWKDTAVLGEYIEAVEENFGLDAADRQLLESWKHPVSGTFILERHLSRGSIFIDAETRKVYQVKGLTDSWGAMLKGLTPPFPVEATLIPFHNCIISDGLVMPMRVSFGPEYREIFKQLYLKARQEGNILTCLERAST